MKFPISSRAIVHFNVFVVVPYNNVLQRDLYASVFTVVVAACCYLLAILFLHYHMNMADINGIRECMVFLVVFFLFFFFILLLCITKDMPDIHVAHSYSSDHRHI